MGGRDGGRGGSLKTRVEEGIWGGGILFSFNFCYFYRFFAILYGGVVSSQSLVQQLFSFLVVSFNSQTPC